MAVLTIFAASARLDLARLWLRCVQGAFGNDDIAIEIFGESEGGLRPELLPGATILRPEPGRRDYQEALNDALTRVSTPYLAFIDTDVFCTSRDVWMRARSRLEDERVAAVSCVSRTATEGHGTFAVFLKVAPYRAALEDVPDGFWARVEREEPGDPPGRWFGQDTGDLLMRAVIARGFVVELLHLEEAGTFVKFDALTGTWLLETWSGDGPLLELAKTDAYFRDSCLGNLALGNVYRRVFPEGPAYEFSLSRWALWKAIARGGLRSLKNALSSARRIRGGARRVERFLAS